MKEVKKEDASTLTLPTWTRTTPLAQRYQAGMSAQNSLLPQHLAKRMFRDPLRTFLSLRIHAKALPAIGSHIGTDSSDGYVYSAL